MKIYIQRIKEEEKIAFKIAGTVDFRVLAKLIQEDDVEVLDVDAMRLEQARWN